MDNDTDPLDILIEAAIMAADRPMTVSRLGSIFSEENRPEKTQIMAVLERLEARYRDRGIQLHQVASGYRFQVNEAMTPKLKRLWETKPPRYSRALLETLAIIAYKQPMTRGEVEAIRGVSVSGSIMRTLLDNEWVNVVGQREVPGRPALYGTTKEFLDHFNLKTLSELPALPDVSLSHEENQEMFDVLDGGENIQENSLKGSLHSQEKDDESSTTLETIDVATLPKKEE